MESGVTITSSENAVSINAFATIYVTLETDHADLTRSWQNALGIVRQIISEAFQNESFRAVKGQFLNRINNIKKLLDAPGRYRRYLDPFEGIGSIGANILGLATTGDVKKLAEASEKLAGAIDGVITTQEETIAVVNKLGHAQQEIQEKISEIIGTVNLYRSALSELEGRLTALKEDQKLTKLAIILESLLADIETQITDFHYHLDQSSLARSACEAGIVNSKLVSDSLLEELLTQPNNRVSMSHISYYQYMTVERIITIDKITYCIIQAPLLDDEIQKLYHINTFPICHPNQGCLRIYRDAVLVMGTTSGDIFFPEKCYGRHPVACSPGVIYSKSQQPCLHGLISGDIEQQKLCPITYTKEPEPAHPITTTVKNRYILRTDAVLYHYRCNGQRPLSKRLESGTYVITVEENCNMDAGLWLLKGLSNRIFTVNVSLPEPKPIDLSHLNLYNETKWNPIRLPPGIKQLEFSSYEELVAPKETHLEKDIREIQKNIGKRDLFWLWIIIGIISAFGVALLLWKIFTTKYFLQICCKRNLKTNINTEQLIPTPSVNQSEPKVQLNSEPYWSVHVQTDKDN